ncbi:Uncharacterised protein [Enterococcus faecalis]|nr:Uncharacterised protein [Enterococcus faecalis]
MADKTIKELAEELGVSKTAINKKVSDENRKLWFAKIGNKFVINEVGQKAIKSMFLAENENLNRQPVCEKTKTENHKNANQVSDLELLPFLKKTVGSKRYTATRKRYSNKTNTKTTRPATTTHSPSKPTNREATRTATINLHCRNVRKRRITKRYTTN